MSYYDELQHLQGAERTAVASYERLFNLLNDCDIDIWLVKHCDYENYCRIRKLCLEGTGNADKCVDCDKEVINLPTEDEFNELKEVLLCGL